MAGRVAYIPTAFSLDTSGKATKSFKDEAHLAFIRRLPSPISGQYGCDPAHISAGSPIHNKKRTGGGQRASDCWVVPLTRTEHDAQHDHGDELAWWRLQGIDPFELAIKLYEVTGQIEAAEIIIRNVREAMTDQHDKRGHTPWGVHTIGSIYQARCSAGLPDGSYVHAVAMPYDGNRLRAAWWVLTGRAYALVWPEAGDLEKAMGINLRRRHPHVVDADTALAERSKAGATP